jgi:two-component system nitrate/nitrite sensor histidine kinase NarX
MPAETSSRPIPVMTTALRWYRRLLWGKLSRPLVFLALLLLGSAVTTIYALTGSQAADWIALALALTALGVMLVLLRRVRRRLRFVRHLDEWAKQMRGGDLAAQIPMSREADLADVIEDINSLGTMLEKLAHEMDAQSATQTVRLARKTQSLDILYEVALSLSRAGSLDQQLGGFLDTFIELVDARAATVHQLQPDRGMRLLASRRFDAAKTDPGDSQLSDCPHCGWSVYGRDLHILTAGRLCAQRPQSREPGDMRDDSRDGGGRAASGTAAEVTVVPVHYQDRPLGIYTLYLDWPVSSLGEDMHELLIAIGRHLGLAIEKARLDTDARRLAIMEERNLIGNELHDSLAQALVGMRLQVKLLGELLHRKDLRAAQSETRNLKLAVDDAHNSLRELLANFRLKIDDRGLVPAVANLIERFRQETSITVFFQNECPRLVLTPRQEIQVFYIIQEALANVRKHSHAHTVRILLNCPRENAYAVLVEDDGAGIVTPLDTATPGEHIGLSIMHERAQRLPGELSIESEPGEGTRVLLTFSTASAEASPARVMRG